MARRTFTQRKTIDNKQWDAIPATRLSESTTNTFLGGSIAFNVPATILRCRGQVWAAMDATKQVSDLFGVVVALGILSTDAVTLGATAAPDPGGEPEYPWLWWGQMLLEAFVAAGTEAWGTSAQRLEVDTKGMRKVKPGQSLVWVAQVNVASGAPLITIELGQVRVLIGT